VVDRQSPERGLIWERLHTSDAELQMPPADSGRTLSGAAGDPRSLAARGARRDSRTGPFARPGRLPCRASPDRPGRATRSTLSWSTDCRVSRWHRPRRRAARPVGAAVPRAAASRRRTAILQRALARARQRYAADPESARGATAIGDSTPDPQWPAGRLAAYPDRPVAVRLRAARTERRVDQ
jgi:hypothetical protein